MQITMNSSNDPVYEALFGDFIKQAFGLSFAPWFKLMLWDERYESYSIIENGSMLANICVYKTDMLIGGKPVCANQLGGVATRMDQRGKGLSRALTEHILAKYKDTPCFLSANPSVLNFYPRFGFRQVQDYRPTLAIGIDNQDTKAVKLRAIDERVMQAIYHRTVYSNMIDSVNTQPIQVFNLLAGYSDHIYYLAECGAVIVAKQTGNTLFVVDVMACHPLSFEAVQKELPFSGVRRVAFGFCPDWLGVKPEWEPADMDEEPFFIRGDWCLPEKFRFPLISET